jgi:uncharacterized membrane protein YkvA (DUF1232 family)
MGSWKEKAKNLKRDAYLLYLARRDPRIPWYAKALALIVVAYAFSPIDLIPDPIPVLGYLDDLIIIPLGITLVIKLIPQDVWQEYRAKAESAGFQKPKSWGAAAVIVVLWLLALAWLGMAIFRIFAR